MVAAGKRRNDMRVETIERTLRGAVERRRAQLFAREGHKAQLPQQRARLGRLSAERHIKALALRRRGGRNELRRASRTPSVEASKIRARATCVALDRQHQMHRRKFGVMRCDEICFRTWRETRREGCDRARYARRRGAMTIRQRPHSNDRSLSHSRRRSR